MTQGIRIMVVIVGTVAVLSVGAFFYLTREIAAPSANVEDSVEQLETSDESGSEIVFRISQDESQVEYTLDEVLNGADKTVVGTTSEVAGDILVNLSDLSQAEMGEISINARTFATDDERRDNSVARFILQSESDANEFITFQPTSVTALADSAGVGDTLEFEVTGDLTIAGTTSAVTFDVTASLESEGRLVGQAETVVAYADFNLSIPDVPFVASVEDEVTLTLDFVANAVSGETTEA